MCGARRSEPVAITIKTYTRFLTCSRLTIETKEHVPFLSGLLRGVILASSFTYDLVMFQMVNKQLFGKKKEKNEPYHLVDIVSLRKELPKVKNLHFVVVILLIRINRTQRKGD